MPVYKVTYHKRIPPYRKIHFTVKAANAEKAKEIVVGTKEVRDKKQIVVDRVSKQKDSIKNKEFSWIK